MAPYHTSPANATQPLLLGIQGSGTAAETRCTPSLGPNKNVEFHGKTTGTWENHRKFIGKPEENVEINGNPKKKHGLVYKGKGIILVV